MKWKGKDDCQKNNLKIMCCKNENNQPIIIKCFVKRNKLIFIRNELFLLFFWVVRAIAFFTFFFSSYSYYYTIKSKWMFLLLLNTYPPITIYVWFVTECVDLRNLLVIEILIYMKDVKKYVKNVRKSFTFFSLCCYFRCKLEL